MKSIASVSGGKTSSYMALKYEFDEYIFALVGSNDARLEIKDASLAEYCRSKVPGFVGTYESPKTLDVLRSLEQMLGKEIKWVAAEYPLEDFVNRSTDLPGYRTEKPMLYNKRARFCTVEQKIKPISRYCWIKNGEPVIQGIGYRWDEPRRVEKWNCKNDKAKIPVTCGLSKTQRWKYQTVEWRISDFPLYRDRITHSDVRKFWDSQQIDFPSISNCVMCPFHTDLELRSQRKEYPQHYEVARDQEIRVGATFGDRNLDERTKEPDFEQKSLFSCLCS